MNDVAFTIFGLSIHWYGIIITLAIVLAVVLGCFLAKFRGLKTDDIFEILLWVIIPAIIGARLYFLIFNGGPWGWESFAIWSGGLAVYGSVIGGAFGVMLYCLVRKKNFLDVADVAAPCLILGQAIGRIGCYFAGCCYGVETTNESLQYFPMSVMINGEWHLATFFYESFFNFLLCIALVLILVLPKKNVIKGVVLSGYMIGYGIIRAFLEGLRDDTAALFIGSIKVSQFLSILIIIGGVALLITQLAIYFKKAKKIKMEV